MNFRRITPLVAAACLLTSFSVSAQRPAPPNVTSPEPRTTMSCQEMIEKAEPTVDQMTDQNQMKAQREIERAKADMQDSKWNSCKSHMQSVLDLTNTSTPN